MLVLLAACSDNATRLSYAIERATHAPGEQAVQRVTYRPRTVADVPYFLVFFPERRTTLDDLVAAGLPKALASRVFTEMAYLPIGEAPFLVVVQEGERLAFTTHWSQFAAVANLLVVPATGTVGLTLRPSSSGTMVEVDRRDSEASQDSDTTGPSMAPEREQAEPRPQLPHEP